MSNRGLIDNNRTIIIPPGTVDPDELNIVYIPPGLSSTTPLLVKPARGPNKPLRAGALPIWEDELSQASTGGKGYLEVRNVGCSTEPRPSSFPPETFENADDCGFCVNENVEKNEMCASPVDDGKQILKVSTKTIRSTNDGPTTVEEMDIDAPEGIDASLLENVIAAARKPKKQQCYDPYGSSNTSQASSSGGQFSNMFDQTTASEFGTFNGTDYKTKSCIRCRPAPPPPTVCFNPGPPTTTYARSINLTYIEPEVAVEGEASREVDVCGYTAICDSIQAEEEEDYFPEDDDSCLQECPGVPQSSFYGPASRGGYR